MKKNPRSPEGMNPEKKNQITRDLMMGWIFDPTNFAGDKVFTRLHEVARRVGINDEDFDNWFKELLQERNSRLSVIPMRVTSEPEDEVEHSWAARADATQFFR